jgi:putative transposase
MEKYKDKYRIPSARHPFWDYGWNAAYFVTLCTQNRECWFGDVVEGRMQLSPIGHIANSCWYEIPHHFPFVELASHVIMPNHVHGIVVINKMDDGSDNRPNIQRDDGYPDESNMETQNLASLQSKSPSQQHNSNPNPEIWPP